MSAEGDSSSLPGRTIHGAYRDCLQARSDYQRAIGGPMEGAAHEQLHDAVANYYEALRPLISSANVTEKLWEEDELWPVRPLFEEVGYCPSCGGHAASSALQEKGIQVGSDLCPWCENAVLERDRAAKTDENGQVVYEWVQGLESLTDAWDRVEEVQVEYEDGLGPYSTTKREAVLLDPSRLLTVARKLDEALERLNLHAEIDDDVDTTPLDKEDIEQFAEQVQKIREQHGDGESLAEKEAGNE